MLKNRAESYAPLRLISRQEYAEAHAIAIADIQRDVRDARAYHALGRIAFEHGNFTKAEELFAKAESYAPTVPLYVAERAKLASVQSDRDTALTHVERALGLAPTSAQVLDMLGVVLSRAGYHGRAIELFEQAVAADSGPANVHYNLAASLQFSGEFERAEAAYREALKRDPNLFRARSALTSLRKQEEGALPDLMAAWQRQSSDTDAKLHIGHGIAKVMEDLGRYEESLDWLLRAKADKRAEFPVDAEAQAEMFAMAAKVASAPVARNANVAAPIFVTGLPRTGTTLVDRILSSHPDVTSAGELNLFADLVKREAATDGPHVLDGPTLEAVSDENLTRIGRDYVAAAQDLVRGLDPKATRFVDKMPLNILYAGLIHRALPHARIVVLRRGAMDSCLSNFRQLFSTSLSYYNYTFDLEATAEFYRAFDDLVQAFADTLPSDRFLQIHYEDIVFDQEAQTRRLLEFCGLEWNARTLDFHLNAAPVSTASAVQVRQPLYSGSIGRWKRYGDKLDGLRDALSDFTKN